MNLIRYRVKIDAMIMCVRITKFLLERCWWILKRKGKILNRLSLVERWRRKHESDHKVAILLITGLQFVYIIDMEWNDQARNNCK